MCKREISFIQSYKKGQELFCDKGGVVSNAKNLRSENRNYLFIACSLPFYCPGRFSGLVRGCAKYCCLESLASCLFLAPLEGVRRSQWGTRLPSAIQRFITASLAFGFPAITLKSLISVAGMVFVHATKSSFRNTVNAISDTMPVPI